MRVRFPRRGRYRGRLAFNPDTGFHEDTSGRRVVTYDGGSTWRYARRGDTSHQARYSLRVVTVDSTANRPDGQPHHWGVQPDDLHHDPSAPGTAKPLSHPDGVSEYVTSHTDAPHV